MAGRGPAPKAPEQRQRRNKTSTHADLAGGPVVAPRDEAPPLPARRCGCQLQPGKVTRKGSRKPRCSACNGTGLEPWHERTKAFWEDVWSSPMVAEFAQADVHALFMLALLVDRFWWSGGDLDVAKEVRLQSEKFGLTPLSRRSLQWRLPKPDQSVPVEEETAEPRMPAEDPRKVLRMVARGGGA